MRTIVLALFFFIAAATAADTDVYFCDHGGCTKAVVENLLVIHDPALAAEYAANWHACEKHSIRCAGKALGTGNRR
jgi:hypothetical protein